MKKRNNAFARLVGLLLVSATVLTLTVAATGGAGTSSDPLVTLRSFPRWTRRPPLANRRSRVSSPSR